MRVRGNYVVRSMVGGWVSGTNTDAAGDGVGVVMVLRAGIMIMICYLFVTFFVLVLSCRLCLLRNSCVQL